MRTYTVTIVTLMGRHRLAIQATSLAHAKATAQYVSPPKGNLMKIILLILALLTILLTLGV